MLDLYSTWLCPDCKALRWRDPRQCDCGYREIHQYITLETYFGANPYTDELKANAKEFLLGLNSLLAVIEAAIPKVQFPMTSGYRTPEHNAAVGGSKNSKHTQAKAIDLSDNNRLIGVFLSQNLQLLKSRTFAMEDLDATVTPKGNKWCHLQLGLPPSGNLIFKP